MSNIRPQLFKNKTISAEVISAKLNNFFKEKSQEKKSQNAELVRRSSFLENKIHEIFDDNRSRRSPSI